MKISKIAKIFECDEQQLIDLEELYNKLIIENERCNKDNHKQYIELDDNESIYVRCGYNEGQFLNEKIPISLRDSIKQWNEDFYNTNKDLIDRVFERGRHPEIFIDTDNNSLNAFNVFRLVDFYTDRDDLIDIELNDRFPFYRRDKEDYENIESIEVYLESGFNQYNDYNCINITTCSNTYVIPKDIFLDNIKDIEEFINEGNWEAIKDDYAIHNKYEDLNIDEIENLIVDIINEREKYPECSMDKRALELDKLYLELTDLKVKKTLELEDMEWE